MNPKEMKNIMKVLKNNKSVFEIVKQLKLLKKAGFDNEKIRQTIFDLKLPMAEHLYILGNFSRLIEFVR